MMSLTAARSSGKVSTPARTSITEAHRSIEKVQPT